MTTNVSEVASYIKCELNGKTIRIFKIDNNYTCPGKSSSSLKEFLHTKLEKKRIKMIGEKDKKFLKKITDKVKRCKIDITKFETGDNYFYPLRKDIEDSFIFSSVNGEEFLMEIDPYELNSIVKPINFFPIITNFLLNKKAFVIENVCRGTSLIPDPLLANDFLLAIGNKVGIDKYKYGKYGSELKLMNSNSEIVKQIIPDMMKILLIIYVKKDMPIFEKYLFNFMEFLFNKNNILKDVLIDEEIDNFLSNNISILEEKNLHIFKKLMKLCSPLKKLFFYDINLSHEFSEKLDFFKNAMVQNLKREIIYILDFLKVSFSEKKPLDIEQQQIFHIVGNICCFLDIKIIIEDIYSPDIKEDKNYYIFPDPEFFDIFKQIFCRSFIKILYQSEDEDLCISLEDNFIEKPLSGNKKKSKKRKNISEEEGRRILEEKKLNKEMKEKILLEEQEMEEENREEEERIILERKKEEREEKIISELNFLKVKDEEKNENRIKYGYNDEPLDEETLKEFEKEEENFLLTIINSENILNSKAEADLASEIYDKVRTFLKIIRDENLIINYINKLKSKNILLDKIKDFKKEKREEIFQRIIDFTDMRDYMSVEKFYKKVIEIREKKDEELFEQLYEIDYLNVQFPRKYYSKNFTKTSNLFE